MPVAWLNPLFFASLALGTTNLETKKYIDDGRRMFERQQQRKQVLLIHPSSPIKFEDYHSQM